MEPNEDVYYYEYKGKTYYVEDMAREGNTDDTAKMKVDGEWVPAVTYHAVRSYTADDDSSVKYTRIDWRRTFIRPQEDFLSKFKPLPDFKETY